MERKHNGWKVQKNKKTPIVFCRKRFYNLRQTAFLSGHLMTGGDDKGDG